ncbi:MAG: hypothetical protein U9Q62_06685 [Campylobacterota bacterium]|nr:hypothetical protein [Campylobacterota bacterium]
MLRSLLLILVCFSFLQGAGDYSLRFALGKASLSNLPEIVEGENETHPENLMAYGIDGGYRLSEAVGGWPVDIYLKGAFYYFQEEGTYIQRDPSVITYGKVYEQEDVYEGILYFKLYWNIDMWKNRLRLGAGNGFSYVSDIPLVEKMEAEFDRDNQSRLLNYMEFTLDVDIGRLFMYKPLFDTSFGFFIKHRSGIYGTINNVKEGGYNYNMLYIEKNF